MLEAALAAGIASAGGDVLLGGVLPTPAAPLLIERYGLDLAAVISASHNPYDDNGIKFFGADGFKLSDATELAIEARLDAPRAGRADADRPHPRAARHARGLPARAAGALRGPRPRRRRRRARLRATARPTASRRRSSAASARRVTVLADAPDGRNINDGCGSTHVDALVAAMRDGGHDVGFAFDGDGDRVLAVDRDGRGRRRRRADRAGGAAPARAGPPARRRRRRDGHDELRLPHRDARRRRRGRDDAGRRPLRARGAARARLGARRRAVRATSSTWASCRPATGSPARC